jgi:DNA repair protein RecN (Recombination protein N)
MLLAFGLSPDLPMLTDLSIKNFAIIDSLHISFGSGLNVLTGETGAGKSIIIDAANLLLGGRASADLIRSGADEAAVEAMFTIGSDTALRQFLSDRGVEAEDELLLKRVISLTGKNRIFINGSLATLATLAEIACRLVNIYGQHESQTLLKIENHLELLDDFAGLGALKAEFAATWRTCRKITEQLSVLESGARDAERQRDLLAYQLDEIASAGLIPGEDEELERERNLLVHAERLLQKTGSAYELLYGAEESALGMLGTARSALLDAAGVDGSLAPLCETVAAAALQLEDAALTLRDYAARIESDPLRLQAVEERLELIRKLKKKYGAAIAEILSCRDRMAAELLSLTDLDGCRAGLEQEEARQQTLLRQQGEELSARRRSAAGKLQQALEKEVQQLAMKHAVFPVKVEALLEPRESGFDRVEFLFSPNPGELPRPLAKIASGGELSRIMLAMKQLHPESDVPTLIFDEVDTGIGGATSSLVGRKLKTVAGRQQVLCITHLPQVAVFADHHYLVSKSVAGGRTETSLQLLAGESRIDEIARMLGGVTVTAKSREHAAEMLEAAAHA